MKQLFLLWIALAVSIVGVLLLFFIKPQVSPAFLSMTGEVTGKRTSNGAMFITMVPENFTVVAFDDLSIEPGNHTLHGRLQEYKGKVEFVVNSYD